MPPGSGLTAGVSARRSRMIAVALSAELVWQLTGANLSSPQSNELQAKQRAPTLSKWVNLTNVEAVLWVGFLAVLDGTGWPVVGGGLAAGSMALKYRYAIRSGLASGAPSTWQNNPR